MVVGVTGKFPPLAEVPNKLPPDDVVHQLTVKPEVEALKSELIPHEIVDGVVVTFDGLDGVPILTVTDDLTGLEHGLIYDSA